MDPFTHARYLSRINAVRRQLDALAAEMEKLVAAKANLQAELDRLHSAPAQQQRNAHARAVQRKGNRIGPPGCTESAPTPQSPLLLRGGP